MRMNILQKTQNVTACPSYRLEQTKIHPTLFDHDDALTPEPDERGQKPINVDDNKVRVAKKGSFDIGEMGEGRMTSFQKGHLLQFNGDRKVGEWGSIPFKRGSPQVDTHTHTNDAHNTRDDGFWSVVPQMVGLRVTTFWERFAL